ncbi:protein STRUBBELIG-RECEPTOR FAMILY 7 isoform X2 [Daucus carota subsp. sativus]|uniref:protein STRUBBELIG-RECEPTOR FAMILY 7 isoform X2 n=1 Tax=Daucus carota subsp. sativus TaxID=79200 RepID=UPI0030827273
MTCLDRFQLSLLCDLPESFAALSSMANMNLQNNQFTGSIDVLSNLPQHNLNIGNNHFSGWIPERLKNINIYIYMIILTGQRATHGVPVLHHLLYLELLHPAVATEIENKMTIKTHQMVVEARNQV